MECVDCKVNPGPGSDQRFLVLFAGPQLAQQIGAGGKSVVAEVASGLEKWAWCLEVHLQGLTE